MRPPAQGDKILLIAQKRVDAHIIGSIIAVVAVRFKDRIEVDDPHAQLRQRRQLFGDPGKISAEVIVAAEFPVGIGGALRLLLPALVQSAVGGNAGLRLAAAIKAVGEDLIHDLPRKLLGDLVIFIIDGKLPQLSLAVIGAAVGGSVQQGSVRKAKTVVIQSRLLRGIAQEKGISLPLHGRKQHGLRLPCPVQQQRGAASVSGRQGKAQGHFLPCRHRTKGRFIFRQQAVKHECSVLSIGR